MFIIRFFLRLPFKGKVFNRYDKTLSEPEVFKEDLFHLS